MAFGLRGGVALGVAIGLGVGIGVAIMAPSVFPRTARAFRPLAKRTVREGMNAYMRAREGLAEFGEYAEDLLAETEAELKSARHAAGRAATAATGMAESGADEPPR